MLCCCMYGAFVALWVVMTVFCARVQHVYTLRKRQVTEGLLPMSEGALGYVCGERAHLFRPTAH